MESNKAAWLLPESRREASVEPATPGFRAAIDKLHAEDWEYFGPMLDAKLMEAQTVRKAEGHKARERTLRSEDMARARQNQSIATE